MSGISLNGKTEKPLVHRKLRLTQRNTFSSDAMSFLEVWNGIKALLVPLGTLVGSGAIVSYTDKIGPVHPGDSFFAGSVAGVATILTYVFLLMSRKLNTKIIFITIAGVLFATTLYFYISVSEKYIILTDPPMNKRVVIGDRFIDATKM